MADEPKSGGPARPAAYDPARDLAIHIEDLQKTIAIATALSKSRRKVDLAGLEHAIGVLCAKTLDLMPDEGRTLRPALIEFVRALDGLIAVTPPK